MSMQGGTQDRDGLNNEGITEKEEEIRRLEPLMRLLSASLLLAGCCCYAV
jgi:hypothetical protein